MSYEQYKKYINMGLKPYQFEFMHGENEGLSSNFSDTSFLSENGYRNTKNTPRFERWEALKRTIDSGVSHWMVIEKLEEFISLRESNPSMADAIQRYREDIDYVSWYQAKYVEGKVFEIKRG